jgi:hypothetical protein
MVSPLVAGDPIAQPQRAATVAQTGEGPMAPPIARKHEVGMINWRFVPGMTQTQQFAKQGKRKR